MIFYDNKDELFGEPLILQEKDEEDRNYKNKLYLLDLQHLIGLKISKP